AVRGGRDLVGRGVRPLEGARPHERDLRRVGTAEPRPAQGDAGGRMSDRGAEQAGVTGGSTHGAMGAVTPGAAGVESPGATEAPEGLPAFVNVRPGTGS